MAEYDALGPPESANSPTSDSPADMGLLADHLGLTWNDTTDFSRVTVLSASAGTWPPPFRHDNVTPGAESGAESAPCTTPKLWLFLYGHYRSFDTTQASIKAMAGEGRGGGGWWLSQWLERFKPPRSASLHLASLRPASPYLTLPCPASPYLALPLVLLPRPPPLERCEPDCPSDESTGGCYMVVAVMPERLDGGKFAGGSARSQVSVDALN